MDVTAAFCTAHYPLIKYLINSIAPPMISKRAKGINRHPGVGLSI